MKRLEMTIAAVAAAILTGCGVPATNDEPVTAAPTPVTTTTTPTVAETTTEPATPAPVNGRDTIHTSGARIDASAFINALVESGCQIDKAEYKEVKRGGAIKVVCSKSLDPLEIDLDDF